MTRARSGTALGVACMVVGSALLTLNDALLKWLAAGLPIGQMLALRGLFAVPLIVLAAGFIGDGGLARLRVRSYRLQAARALLTVSATFMFVSGLARLPLADAIAVTFAGPLFLTALAALLLGERVGWRRWSAVATGFCGVLIMLQPDGGALQWALLLPLGASLCGALRDILTRHMSGGESSLATLLFTLSAVALAGFTTLPLGWQAPRPLDWTFLALTSALVVAAQFLLIETFRHAEASLVAPFKYTSFVWATLYGALIWRDLPRPWTLAGAALVIVSGLYIFQRETRRRADC